MKVKVVALPVETWDAILRRIEGSDEYAALDFALGKTEEIESPTYEGLHSTVERSQPSDDTRYFNEDGTVEGLPIYEVINKTRGQHFKVYRDGHCEGFDYDEGDHSYIINRMPFAFGETSGFIMGGRESNPTAEPFLTSPSLVNRLRPDSDKSEYLHSAMIPAILPERNLAEAMEDVIKTLESQVEWTQVESSNLSAIAYQEDLQLLLVEFKGGEVYKYAGVPYGVYSNLLNVESKGSYFATAIRDHFPSERLEVKSEQD